MKTFGRIMIVLAVFALVMGITYRLVSAASPSTDTAAPQNGEGAQSQFRDSERPEFPRGGRAEFGREGPGGGWVFGMLKNTGVVAMIVVLVVGLKSLTQRKPVPVRVR